MDIKTPYIVDVESDDDGNQFITLPDQVIQETGWKEHDIIEWTDNKDGSWTMTKLEIEPVKTELVLVEVVQQFKMCYAIEVPQGKADWALDTVALGEAVEFAQTHIGDNIVGHRVISQDEYLQIFEKEEKHSQGWSEEMKLSCINKWED